VQDKWAGNVKRTKGPDSSNFFLKQIIVKCFTQCKLVIIFFFKCLLWNVFLVAVSIIEQK